MIDPPKLADTDITAAIQSHYGMSTDSVTFLPIGNDSATWVYRVQTNDGRIFFLKIRSSEGFRLASLAVPTFLCDQGLDHIISPVPTLANKMTVKLNNFTVILYPFIDGNVGAHIGLSPQNWQTFGALARRIHSCQLPHELLQLVPQETFIPNRRSIFTELETYIAKQVYKDDVERKTAAFWHARGDEICAVAEQAAVLGRRLSRQSNQMVLCHADMHTWNILLDYNQQLWLMDWDEVVLALKERDLMFVVGGIGGDGVGLDETATFLEGYGDSEIDIDALAYYRCAWAVQDITEYSQRVFFEPDSSQEARIAAMEGFMGLFAPGDIVTTALASTTSAE
ncbi:MAG TPA: phosphotransferase [candidate division Zixibacteria bacterium]|nr:phosphotransferase [candidate division Zixibacteria bacterium]